jgi:hypothetical protein
MHDTQTVRDGFKLLGQHVEGCYGLADEDGITFVVQAGVEWDRDRIGRKGGSTMWHRFKCNDIRCEAVLLVRWDTLAAFVNDRAADWFDSR